MLMVMKLVMMVVMILTLMLIMIMMVKVMVYIPPTVAALLQLTKTEMRMSKLL